MAEELGDLDAGRRMRRPSFALTASITLGLSLLQCGTSARVVHEGTMHFEHCYRLDHELASNDGERLACWQTWSSRHAARHPGDRAGYAERRRGEISAGPRSAPPAVSPAAVVPPSNAPPAATPLPATSAETLR